MEQNEQPAAGRVARSPRRWRAALAMGVYQVVFAGALLAYAPVLLWRLATNPAYRRGIPQRFGRVPRSSGERPVVWVHGVSVGELKVAGTLIERLRTAYPEAEIVLSATTPTGHALAERVHADLRVIFYPLDFGPFPRRALARVRPACVLLVELEVWPNFLRACRHSGVPVAVVNGRMSEKSFRGYRLLRGVLPQFDLIQRFCVQDASYRDRLLALGVPDDRVFVTGNVKYDSVRLKDPTEASADLRRWLSPDGRHVLVCGSTHGDEDLGVARAVRRVAREIGAPIRLVLAPRHPERAVAVREDLVNDGETCVAWSKLPTVRPPLLGTDIVVVDTIGQLETFYGACDVAFVGGSMVPRGGQNMLEPAALGKAVVFGQHIVNFRNDVALLLAAGAAVQVRDWDDLAAQLRFLFENEARRQELGEQAVDLIRGNQGATDRTMALLRGMLDPGLGPSTVPSPSGDRGQDREERDAEQGQHNGSVLRS
ncbi:MAG: 3-deoxy-D-manno-octulosonic acid transferase [Planctomycetota bacterium]